MPPDLRQRQLRRMKLGALALLALMLCGFGLSLWMGRQGIWGWICAFCEAATVGALADWFAVTALFRRPMGLPIPHTAIIPANKERIANSLAAFVRDHFMDPPVLLAKLDAFDPAGRLGTWLAKPQQVRRAVDIVRNIMLRSLDLLDEEAVRQAIQHFVISQLRRWNAANTAGEILGLLTRNGRHQALLDTIAVRIGEYLNDTALRARISRLLVRFAKKQWPKTIKVVDKVVSIDSMADQLANRLALSFMDELQSVLAHSDHPLRQQYDHWLTDYIHRLREDPELARQVDAIKLKIIEHPQWHAYIQGLWTEVRASIRSDLATSDSLLGKHLEQTLRAFAAKLGEDPELRRTINTHILASAESLVTQLRSGVTEHIAQTVNGWDERQLVKELELSVGRDLQYVRYNGTLVGGLIGLVLYCVAGWIG